MYVSICIYIYILESTAAFGGLDSFPDLSWQLRDIVLVGLAKALGLLDACLRLLEVSSGKLVGAWGILKACGALLERELPCLRTVLWRFVE